VEKVFNKAHQELLLLLLSSYVDQGVLELFRKFLKVGYIDIHNVVDRSMYLIKGLPRVSVLSPILTNLYFNELDKIVQSELLFRYNKGSPYCMQPNVLKDFLGFNVNDISGIPFKQVNLQKNSRNNLIFKGLYYVRYADTLCDVNFESKINLY